MKRKRLFSQSTSLSMESLESRDLLTIAIVPTATTVPKDSPVKQVPVVQPATTEVRSIQLREDPAAGIQFDDTRLGDVYITNASGVERFINITQRSDGRREYGIVAMANLFDVLPADSEGSKIEIVSASLELSSHWEAGVGSTVSVFPIQSTWLSREPGQNESQPSLDATGMWAGDQFGPADYSNSHGTTVVWTAGKNEIDITTALQSMYVTSGNQGFAIVADAGTTGERADLLISTSDHWIPTERPTFNISYRYVATAEPTQPNPTEPTPDVPANAPRILSESIPNTANPNFSLTRYYAEQNSDVLSHNQSGELTGFSPDGKWHQMLVGLENWYLRNVETGEIRFAHKTTAGQAGNGDFQWTERNNYLRFAASGVLEEVDPATREVVNRAELAIATLGEEDRRSVDYHQFRLGQSSGADGIYVLQYFSLDDESEQEWFINVLDTSNGRFQEQYFYAFDETVHQNDATSNRWRELYYTNQTFNVHLSPFGREGSGTNNVGGQAYYNFPANGDGRQWQQVSLTSDIPDTVRSDAQSHRTLETIDGTTYVAYSTWRGSFNYIVVAEQVSGREVGKLQIPKNQFAVHLQFHKNEIVYSLANVDDESSLRVEAITVDVKSGALGPPQTISDVHSLVNQFSAHVRPFTDADGSYCWHTNEFSAGDSIDVVCATRQSKTESPTPKTPSDPESADLLFAAFLDLSRAFDSNNEGDDSTLEIIRKIGQLV